MQHIFFTLGATTDLVGRLHTFYLPFLCRFPPLPLEQRKTRGTLVVCGIYWWCFILPSSIPIILNHYEDPLIQHHTSWHKDPPFLWNNHRMNLMKNFPRAPGSTENRGGSAPKAPGVVVLCFSRKASGHSTYRPGIRHRSAPIRISAVLHASHAERSIKENYILKIKESCFF